MYYLFDTDHQCIQMDRHRNMNWHRRDTPLRSDRGWGNSRRYLQIKDTTDLTLSGLKRPVDTEVISIKQE